MITVIVSDKVLPKTEPGIITYRNIYGNCLSSALEIFHSVHCNLPAANSPESPSKQVKLKLDLMKTRVLTKPILTLLHDVTAPNSIEVATLGLVWSCFKLLVSPTPSAATYWGIFINRIGIN